MKKRPIKWLVQVAILASISVLLMFFEFNIPILFPNFLKFDFSEIPVLIGGFALGPVAGVVIEGFKIILNLLLEGTETGGVGEIANFIVGVAFVLPASLIYSFSKNKKMALIGLVVGIFSMCVAGALMNYFVILPFYAALYHISMEQLLLGASALIPYITDVKTAIMLGIVPFNFAKSLVISIVVLILYKRVSPLLKSKDALDSETDLEN